MTYNPSSAVIEGEAYPVPVTPPFLVNVAAPINPSSPVNSEFVFTATSNQTALRIQRGADGVGSATFRVDDIIIDTISGYAPDLLLHTDYYAFGQQMPGRKWSVQDYRYGTNGQEKQDELFVGANSAEYWMYDARLGRRWEMDPVSFAWESPYSTMANNPILNDDPDGDWVKASVRTWVRLISHALVNGNFRRTLIKQITDKRSYVRENKLSGRTSQGKKIRQIYHYSYNENSDQNLDQAQASMETERQKRADNNEFSKKDRYYASFSTTKSETIRGARPANDGRDYGPSGAGNNVWAFRDPVTFTSRKTFINGVVTITGAGHQDSGTDRYSIYYGRKRIGSGLLTYNPTFGGNKSTGLFFFQQDIGKRAVRGRIRVIVDSENTKSGSAGSFGIKIDIKGR